MENVELIKISSDLAGLNTNYSQAMCTHTKITKPKMSGQLKNSFNKHIPQDSPYRIFLHSIDTLFTYMGHGLFGWTILSNRRIIAKCAFSMLGLRF